MTTFGEMTTVGEMTFGDLTVGEPTGLPFSVTIYVQNLSAELNFVEEVPCRLIVEIPPLIVVSVVIPRKYFGASFEPSTSFGSTRFSMTTQFLLYCHY